MPEFRLLNSDSILQSVLANNAQIERSQGRLSQERARNTQTALAGRGQLLDAAARDRAIGVQEGQLGLSQAKFGEQVRQTQNQEQQAALFRQGMQQASRQGLPAIKEFLTSQGMAKEALELSKTEAGINKTLIETDKLYRDSQATIKARGASDAINSIMAAPNDQSRNALYKTFRTNAKDKFGLELPDDLTPGTMMALANMASGVDQLSAKIIKDPSLKRSFGQSVIDVLGPDGQAKSASITETLLGALPSAKPDTEIEGFFQLKDRLTSAIAQEVDPARKAELESRLAQVETGIASESKGDGTTINVDTGTDEIVSRLDAQEQRKAKTQISNNRFIINQLEKGFEGFDPDLIRVQGRFETKIAKLADSIGIASKEQKQRIISEINFFKPLEQVFQSAIRKEITGAAAAAQELQQLKDAFLNTDTYSPTEFAAQVRVLIDGFRSELNLNINNLTQGVSLSPEQAGDSNSSLQNVSDVPERIKNIRNLLGGPIL